MTLDAARFLPQSRPRLFIVAVSDSLAIPASLSREDPAAWASSGALLTAYERLDENLRNSWIWWNLAEPFEKPPRLSDLIDLTGTPWDHPEKTARILSMMSGVNRKKIKDAQREGKLRIGTVYRRTRPDPEGRKVQRAEVRFDDVAGCLRTPAGGSSRQTILVVDGPKIRTRLLTAHEAARLMGVDPNTYPIPVNYNAAYHLFGDGLAVPVVSWLNKHLLLKLAQARSVQKAA
jgi:DNA (cytosine-5)-methyltransferase 1